MPRLHGLRDGLPFGVQYEKLIEATRETIETETRSPFGDRFVRGALLSSSPIRGSLRPSGARRSAGPIRRG